MTEERLPDEHCNWVRNDLNLTPGLPFELSEEELNYQPEDWAWSFLRLNENYRTAYKAHALDEDEDLSQVLDGQQAPGLKPDRDGTCGRDFGLAAWIPPSAKVLPRLKNKSDSWFFPLKRPVAEDYRRTEVSKIPYRRPWSRYLPHLDAYPHILANETHFGYRMPPFVPSPVLKLPSFSRKPYSQYIEAPPPFDASTLGLVWAAVDCSIPPAGQVSALTNLAQVVRSALMAEGWKSKKNVRNVEIEHVNKSDAFAHMVFLCSERATDKVTSHQDVWRAVMIDSLAPIGYQKETLLKGLWRIHRELIADGLAQEPRFLRFKNTLAVTERRQEGALQLSSGGSYLKALQILAQLIQLGYSDPAEVAQIIGLRSASNRYIGSWALHFDNDIDQHIADAQQMIAAGYRLLIHEQKPDT
ncbi:hypothetical protein [Massilia timonae]|uniref:hypothetical protein n=1 Tax=Massilia timonae TaxID=47229 RepID=UPI0023560091|nr:hypothetical protein [Massilia timonae]